MFQSAAWKQAFATRQPCSPAARRGRSGAGPQRGLPRPKGALGPSDRAGGPGRPPRGARSPRTKPQAFILAPGPGGGAEPWAVPTGMWPPACPPVPRGCGWWGWGHTTLCLIRPPPPLPAARHHPRSPSRADAVKVNLHVSSGRRGEIKARAVGLVKRSQIIFIILK